LSAAPRRPRLLPDVNVWIALLALAVAHQGALATLDHQIALNAVVGANKAHLMLL
jgi:hypothetical protein